VLLFVSKAAEFASILDLVNDALISIFLTVVAAPRMNWIALRIEMGRSYVHSQWILVLPICLLFLRKTVWSPSALRHSHQYRLNMRRRGNCGVPLWSSRSRETDVEQRSPFTHDESRGFSLFCCLKRCSTVSSSRGMALSNGFANKNLARICIFRILHIS
jgi:hypothetical protein